MAPSAPTTVAAAWAGPFSAETLSGTIEPGDVVEDVPYEQACGSHWVNPETGEPFKPLPSSEPVEPTEPAGETAGEDTSIDAGNAPGSPPEGETHTATIADAGVSTGEEPI